MDLCINFKTSNKDEPVQLAESVTVYISCFNYIIANIFIISLGH
jgi:hypothetical protein